MWNGSTEGELEIRVPCTAQLFYLKSAREAELRQAAGHDYNKKVPTLRHKNSQTIKHANHVLAERSVNSPDPKAAGLFWVKILAVEHLFCFIFREKQAKDKHSEEKWRKYVWGKTVYVQG